MVDEVMMIEKMKRCGERGDVFEIVLVLNLA